ncbi:PilZ domain-containing protein [uncultured Sphingomonas sp.]|uniref:PilZ domain-containing protein n=1 Tax=uncultured Sphingomonas sp. TaxID=158754 RepID=UPI0025FCA9F3|nr:PilZ domain-containing protein [uncultured Sphingomonas sp.]
MASKPLIDNRREPRVPAECRGLARLAVSIEIVDASAAGLRARTSLPLVAGTLLKLTLPGSAERHARVAWVDGNVFGCEFMKPLNVKELRDLVDATANAAPYAICE